MLAKLTCRLSAQNHLHTSHQLHFSEEGVIVTCLLKDQLMTHRKAGLELGRHFRLRRHT